LANRRFKFVINRPMEAEPGIAEVEDTKKRLLELREY
jgi:hypothetical protein